eukprot:9565094-Alexandrium_andersonii.AAC.1
MSSKRPPRPFGALHSSQGPPGHLRGPLALPGSLPSGLRGVPGPYEASVPPCTPWISPPKGTLRLSAASRT